MCRALVVDLKNETLCIVRYLSVAGEYQRAKRRLCKVTPCLLDGNQQRRCQGTSRRYRIFTIFIITSNFKISKEAVVNRMIRYRCIRLVRYDAH